MPSRKPEINIIRELSAYLPGEALEAVSYMLDDPMADLTPGQAARLGAAFSAVGARLTGAAKEHMRGVLLHTDQDVLFRSVPESMATLVNSDEVKKQYPMAYHPLLYRMSLRKAYTSVELPFSLPDRG